MRTGIAVLISASILVSLAACAAPTEVGVEEPVSATCTPAKSGEASDAVSVTGELGTKPVIEFDGPLAPETTERSIAIQGDGDIVENGDQVSVNFTLINAANGTELSSTQYGDTGEQTFAVDEQQFLAGLVKTIACGSVGSRIVGVIPPADAWGDEGSADLGVGAGESIVFVVDLIGKATTKFTAEKFEDMKDMPAVEFDADGAPTITIPDVDAPATSRLGIISEGDGEVVPAASNVTVHYTGINWNTGKVFDSSWERGTPSPFNTSGVVNGFGKAIEGQKVGTKLIVAVTPIDGYGSAGSGENIGPTDTIVFVVEIISLDA